MRIRGLIFGLFFAFLAIISCSSGGKERDAVATVNDAPIVSQELKKEVARYSRQNPAQKVTFNTVEDSLKSMIDQKLLVQEAVKKGLHEKEDFVESIKGYWEQTLIRALVDAKTKELSKNIFATDDEIRKEYDRMSYMQLIRAARAKTKPAADEIAKAMQEGRPPSDVETIGPLYYADLNDSPLADACDMEVGQVKALAAGDEYIVVQVVNREKMPTPPLKDIYPQIRESLLLQKQQSAVKAWIDEVRKSARININDKELRSIAHE